MPGAAGSARTGRSGGAGRRGRGSEGAGKRAGTLSGATIEQRLLLTATLCLLAFGLVMVYSATSATTVLQGGSGGSELVKFAVFDGRLDSPTYGCVNEVTISDTSPGLLIVPPNLYHGWKNIGSSEATIINMPTAMYNYESPDSLDLPWDSEAAARIIPYRF